MQALRSAPRFPLPVDQRLAAQGSSIYQAQCAACHAPTGPRAGTIVPVDEVGTDRVRLDALSPAARERYGASWFADFGKTILGSLAYLKGIIGQLLDKRANGLFINAALLHHGRRRIVLGNDQATYRKRNQRSDASGPHRDTPVEQDN